MKHRRSDDVERSCLSKQVTKTFKQAQRIAKKMSRSYDEVFTAYICRICQGIHITHDTEAETARLKRVRAARYGKSPTPPTYRDPGNAW